MDELFRQTEYQQKLGPNIIEQWVTSHDLAGMIAELIQNDFDAKSRTLRLQFQADRLVAESYGLRMEEDGWARLSFWLGVSQDAAKTESIGKKNFGLRSLFLVGDRIAVSSGGHRTGLDMDLGARRDKITDNATYPPGLSFRSETQYREQPRGSIPLFTRQREEELASQLEEYLPIFVQFLVCTKQQRAFLLPRGKYLLRPYKVEIKSDRLNKSLECYATARQDKQVENLVQRNTHLTIVDNGTAKRSNRRIAEILFSVTCPEGTSINDIPPYYISKDAKRIMCGISFELDRKGNKPLLNAGRLFYPIGMRYQWTGLRLSLNAPFALDMDRDRILPDNDLNKHLATQAGEMAGTLFSAKLLPRFGAAAYLLFASSGNDTPCPEFGEKAFQSMRPCLINGYYEPGKSLKKECFCASAKNGAPKAYLPARIRNDEITPLLDFYPLVTSLIGRERTISSYLAKCCARFDKQILKSLLKDLAIQPFTIHKVCELLVNVNRCEKRFGDGLAWSWSGDGGFRDFYSNMDHVKLVLDALHGQWDLLTSEENDAIKESPWLPAADNSLQCFARLKVWRGDMKDFAWPGRNAILHPDLATHPIFHRSGFKLPSFDVMTIIDEEARAWSQLGETDRDRIFRFIAKNWRHILNPKSPVTSRRSNALIRKMRAVVKNYPILKDSKNDWVTIEQLRIVDDSTKLIFGDSLRYPSDTIPKTLLSVLNAPRGVRTPEDIIKRCEMLGAAPKRDVFAFEDYLSQKKLSKGTRSAIYERLWSLCKVGDAESIQKTSSAYIPSRKLEQALGKSMFPFIVVRNPAIGKFLQRIGVRDKPDYDDMVKYLHSLANTGGFVKDKQSFYAELSDAARRTGLTKDTVSTRLIIMIGHELFPPEEVIISRRQYKYFKNGIRYWPDTGIRPSLKQALKGLGCKENITRDNLLGYLNWISTEYKTNQAIGIKETSGIHRAYMKLGALASGEITADAHVFLSRRHALYSKTDIDNGILCLDDTPELAQKLQQDGAHIEFADYGDARPFIDSTGIKPLSSLIDSVDITVGNQVKEDHDLSKKVSSRFVKNALLSANAQVFDKSLDNDRILKLRKVTLFDSLEKTYRAASVNVTLESKIAVKKNKEDYVICLLDESGHDGGHTRHDYAILSKEISSFLRDSLTPKVDVDDFIMILLMCEDEGQLKKYLTSRSIDYVDHLKQARKESKEEEEEEGAEEEEEEEEKEKEQEEKEEVQEQEEEVTIENLKNMEGRTTGTRVTTTTKRRPAEVVEMQSKIKRLYKKCQICGFPVFEGIRRHEEYGHLRGHHLISWQVKGTVVNGMICLCQPHHHMIHHAKQVIFQVGKHNKSIKVIVNGQLLGSIETVQGHEIAQYMIDNATDITLKYPNIQITVA